MSPSIIPVETPCSPQSPTIEGLWVVFRNRQSEYRLPAIVDRLTLDQTVADEIDKATA